MTGCETLLAIVGVLVLLNIFSVLFVWLSLCNRQDDHACGISVKVEELRRYVESLGEKIVSGFNEDHVEE
jgi:hypothetical protein